MRTALLSAAVLLAVAPAAAQQTIQPGQRLTGELAATDPETVEGTRYDVWRFTGQASHLYRVTLRSDDFDPSLVVGPDPRNPCEDCAMDDGSGGNDARVEYVGRADGTYEIRAFSVDTDAAGRYEIALEDAGVHEHQEPVAGIPITGAQFVTGRLERGDAKGGAGYLDTYTYQGRAGETLAVTLTAIDFTGYVSVGAVHGAECTELDSVYDRDHLGSRFTLTLDKDGAYHIHVGAERQGRVANYTLRLDVEPAP